MKIEIYSKIIWGDKNGMVCYFLQKTGYFFIGKPISIQLNFLKVAIRVLKFKFFMCKNIIDIPK